MPIAQLTALTANLNRDDKKRPEPYGLADFCLFGEVEEGAQPPAAAGAAMLELIRRNLFPSFGFGPWYPDLEKAGKDEPVPPRLILAAEDALLLAPWRVDAEHWGGFLIAEASSAGQRRAFYSENGDEVVLTVPAVIADRGATVAEEAAKLPIA